MLTTGWLFSIVGTITTIIGAIAYNDSSSQGYGLYQYYDRSAVDSSITILVIGIVLLILGVICLLCHYIKQSRKPKLINTIMCLKCNNIVSNTNDFCPNCGNKLKN